jgi:hypothetical protein
LAEGKFESGCSIVDQPPTTNTSSGAGSYLELRA